MRTAVLGRTAYAYSGGKPFDPTLPCGVLIHGALNDHSVWALQSRALAHAGHAVLAVDLPGHGRSAGPAPADVETAAAWIVALLDALHIEKAALAGHSMGSLVALEAAALLGPRATRLALIGTAAPMKVSAALLDGALSAPLAAIDRVTTLSISGLAPKPSAPAPGFWLHGGLRALMRRLQADYARAGHGNLFHHDFALCDRYAGAARAAAVLGCPVQLIFGARDAMTPPRAAQPLVEALGVQPLVLPSGHALMSEAPDGVLVALRTFLRGV